MHRRNFSTIATLAAALTVGAGGSVTPAAPPLAPDEKPRRRQYSSLYGYSGIPYQHLHHVSRETLNQPRNGLNIDVRRARCARRKHVTRRQAITAIACVAILACLVFACALLASGDTERAERFAEQAGGAIGTGLFLVLVFEVL